MPALAVSIVLPTFNRAQMLPQALDSVLEQDYEPLELIVLDDGSVDDTPDVLAGYRQRYGPERIRCERHPNMGQPASINRGYELASGEILGCLSSDDWLLPGAIRLQVQALEAHPDADVVSGANHQVDEFGQVIDTLEAEPETFKGMVQRQFFTIGVGALLRRSLYERVGGWDPAYSSCPDFVFYVRAGPSLTHIVIPEVVGVARRHAQQITSTSAGLQNVRERLRFLDSLFDDAALADELADVRDDAYANLFAYCHVWMLGPRVNGPDQPWLVLDTGQLRYSRLAQSVEQLALPRRRLERQVLSRQLDLHVEMIQELQRTVYLQTQALDHLEAAIADRDSALAQSNGTSRQPTLPSWWATARTLVPPALRHRIEVFARRRVLPRLNGRV